MKIRRIIFGIIIMFFVIAILYNAYNWISRGNQTVFIDIPRNVESNSEVSILFGAKNFDDDSKTFNIVTKKVDLEFLDNEHKKVKDISITNDGAISTIKIPNVEPGNYFIKAQIHTNMGIDDIERPITISSDSKEKIIVTFDKGIYKPNDVVNFRGLILKQEKNTPITTDANISIYDGNDNRVYNKDLKSSDYGIVFGSFKLGEEVNSGIYKLVLSTDNSKITKQFKVNPYVLPKYEVTLTTNKDNYILNDEVTITAYAQYFFGEPVVGAEVSFYVNGQAAGIARTDNRGIATKNYKNTSLSQVYSVKAEVKDSSNYYVEADTSFTVGKDLIKIDLMPEYGNLILDEKNKIYVFTKDAYDNPIKTYLDITAGTYKKQVITSDSGIGIFELDIAGNTGSQQIKVKAESMNGDIVSKEYSFASQNKDILIKTDKVKYNQGEEITLKVDSNHSNSLIYVCKGNNVLKILPADQECKFDLGDVYGFIDIFAKKAVSKSQSLIEGVGSKSQSSQTSQYLFKKTIFIVPKETLSITINKDKEVYEPGENIKLTFETKDENNNSKDTALLVSMLDSSVLALANNDLSIDNIRLALEDIKLSEDIDGATLYSAVLNEESEQDLVGLLLRQGNKSLDIDSYSEKRTQDKREYSERLFVILGCLILFLIIWALLFTKKIKKIVGDILNVLILFFALFLYIGTIIEEISWGLMEDIIIPVIIVIALFSITFYVLVIARFVREHVTRTTYYTFLAYALLLLFILGVNLIGAWMLVVLALLIISLIVLIVRYCKGKIKGEKKTEFVKNLLAGFKDFGAHILSVIVWANVSAVFMIIYAIIIEIIDSILYISYGLEELLYVLPAPILFVTYYLLSYAFYKFIIYKKQNSKNTNNSTEHIAGISIVTIAIVSVIVIGGIMLLSLGVLLFNSSRDIAMSANSSISLDSISSSPSSGHSTSSSIPINGIGNVFNDLSSNLKNEQSYNADAPKVSDYTEEQSVTDEHIRNVFLESMCFVPELVSQNGKAELDLTLSDNITTWVVQAIGNTKDGRIGYGKIDNVKVFKEFFADFELPNNLVKGDKVSIPVTVFNYTEKDLNVSLNVKEQSWFKITGNFDNAIIVKPNETKLVYVPIEVLEVGNNTFRVEAKSDSDYDIIEKVASVVPNGFKIEKVVTTGVLDRDIEDDIILRENVLDNSAKARVKIYSNTISQTVEGVEGILRMPSGCFEQVSSSLYPDIVALRYLRENNIINDELEQKALSYISTGYQKLLSYEVGNKTGGFSLYGSSPAETVLTAYGLMEFKDLETVYDADKNVSKRMVEYLYRRQKSDGSFNIEGYHRGGLDYGSDELAENAYIVWSLSEADPTDERITRSINYLINNLADAKDSYTLSLIANALVNVQDSHRNDVIEILMNAVVEEGDNAYLVSSLRDYYGSYGTRQNNQTTALTSLALSKNSSNQDINKKLINYLISSKDSYGTWYSTQNTVLCLKALNAYKVKGTIKSQTIKVIFNNEEKSIEVDDNSLDVYTVTFDNVSKENKLGIDFGEGEALYEVSLEYYVPYEDVDMSKNVIEVKAVANKNLKVNDTLRVDISAFNKSGINIVNGMIVINIPQGFVVVEESLNRLVAKGIVEKYEMNYRTINLYIRNFGMNRDIIMDIGFRASYPVDITGMQVRAYDYYNPDIEGYSLPQRIIVSQ